jgi:signal transduction histidine kinase
MFAEIARMQQQGTHISGGVHPGLEGLPKAIAALCRLREAGEILRCLRRAARDLTGADGVALLRREGDMVRCIAEDAIGPLWRGMRVSLTGSVSGQAILANAPVVSADVLSDPRVPQELYRNTFVRSLVVVPVGREVPFGALGAYWGRKRQPSPEEVGILEALAGAGAVTLANGWLLGELRRSEAAREELLDNVAHELRTPLTPLRLEVDALARCVERGVGPDRLGRVVGRIDEGLGRLELLVESLLEPGPGPRAEGEPVDLAEVARQAIARLEAPLRESGSILNLHAPLPVLGPWSRRRLEEVVGHLLSNAIRFGRGEPIDVLVEGEEGRARVVVRDRGIGIAPGDRERIFERFGRAVPSREYGGLGIGLWQSRRIVEGHGGFLRLESEPGQGSTFTVLLPR